MKFHYYAETDSLYIELAAGQSVDSVEASPGVVIDIDKNGKIVGLDIEHASESVDLSRLETESLPLKEILMHT
ncbi:hypothetical protein BH10PSE19_BH10PSE19_06750 [soil metagenome]